MNYQLMRKARKAAKITQDDLSALLGVNRATISKYETGVISPPASQLFKIAQILDIDLFALLGDEATSAIIDGFFPKRNVLKTLDQSGTIIDHEGVVAPVDSFIGQFMKVIKDFDNQKKLDFLMMAEYYVELDPADQKQILKFAAFLASNQKGSNDTTSSNPPNLSEAAQFLQNQLLTLMGTDDPSNK